MDGAGFERLDGIPVHHFLQILVIPDFDLLVLVGGSETVKEVEHRQLAGDGGQMRYRGQVHGLLHAVGSQHGKSGLAASMTSE